MKNSKNLDIKTTLEKDSRLAFLNLPKESLELFATKTSAVLKYIEQLNELDTEGVEPTSHAVNLDSNLRPDEVVLFANAEEILNAAPDRAGHFVQVPKVIDSE